MNNINSKKKKKGLKERKCISNYGVVLTAYPQLIHLRSLRWL